MVVLLTSLFVLLSTGLGTQDGPINGEPREQTTVDADSMPRPVRAQARLHDTPLPNNLVIADVFRPFLKFVWQRSPTFRRQCVRLAQHPDVVVSIERVLGTENGAAWSLMKRHAGGLKVVAYIESRRVESYVELIAHELEHVLEQIDGVDLPRLARQRLDGVVRVGGQYETQRAQSVGQAVAREALAR